MLLWLSLLLQILLLNWLRTVDSIKLCLRKELLLSLLLGVCLGLGLVHRLNSVSILLGLDKLLLLWLLLILDCLSGLLCDLTEELIELLLCDLDELLVILRCASYCWLCALNSKWLPSTELALNLS